MSRITAGRVVASMQNPQFIGYLAESDYPSQAMRTVNCAPYAKSSVALVLPVTRPWPAFIWAAFINLLPKVSELPLSEFDRLAGFHEWFSSFIHKFLYVEVRARRTANTVPALDYFTLLGGAVK